jgi:hypothetical protein
MKNSKLIQLYQTIEGNQLEAFKKWVRSPIHNKHTAVLELWEYIFQRQNLTERTLQKEKIFFFICPNTAYNDLKVRHWMSLAVKLLENFIAYWQKKEQLSENARLLAAHATANGQDKYAKQYLRKAINLHQKRTDKSSSFYYEAYQLEKAIFEQKGTKTRIRTTNLQALFDYHSTSFIIETLRYACVAITHQNIYKGTYNIPFLEAILSQIQTGIYADNIAIQLYFNSYQCLIAPSEENYFQTLKQLLFSFPKALPAPEMKDIYLVTINYCVKRLNTGAEQYVQAVFELFRYGLEHLILIENNQLSRFTYKNIVTAALKLKEHKWTGKFIEEYTKYLDTKYQQTYRLFAQAKLALSKQQLNRTQELLWQVDFDDLLLNLGAKMMLIKVHFQQQNWDALEALLSSFYVFLQRKELLSYHRTNYKNILKIIQKMLRTPTFETEARKKIELQIKSTNPLTEREWLLEILHS